jgi:hypothetical protein
LPLPTEQVPRRHPAVVERELARVLAAEPELLELAATDEPRRIGFDEPESAIWTSALATAHFLDTQRPGGTAYVICEAGQTTAMHEVG